jgi:hypothetical protein
MIEIKHDPHVYAALFEPYIRGLFPIACQRNPEYLLACLYAVMSFGGILGIGESYHPLPWKVLTYDPGRGGYAVDISRQQLEGAPSYTSSNQPNWSDQTYG